MKSFRFLPLLAIGALLGGCQAQMLAPMFLQPFDGYVKTETPPTYAAASLGSMPANRIGKATPSGLVLHKGDKILVTKRMDPNWFVFSQQGQEYFIAYDNVSTTPN